MKILIVSDTHMRNENLCSVLELEKDLDKVIHLGDVECGDERIRELLDCPLEIVAGNNDFFCRLPKEKMILLGKYKVLLTHGHYYGVSLALDRIALEAKYRGFDIVMFGHIHRPVLQERDGVMLINPGSLSYPRQMNRRPSYIIMEIDDAGEAHYEIKYL